MANRNECFSDFSKQKTAKERWHSLVSRMGDREEYLETPIPLPLPLPLLLPFPDKRLVENGGRVSRGAGCWGVENGASGGKHGI